MSNNDRLFSQTRAAKAQRQTQRRRLLRGDLAQRDRDSTFRFGDSRAGVVDDWDECIGATVAVRGKLVAE